MVQISIRCLGQRWVMRIEDIFSKFTIVCCIFCPWISELCFVIYFTNSCSLHDMFSSNFLFFLNIYTTYSPDCCRFPPAPSSSSQVFNLNSPFVKLKHFGCDWQKEIEWKMSVAVRLLPSLSPTITTNFLQFFLFSLPVDTFLALFLSLSFCDSRCPLRTFCFFFSFFLHIFMAFSFSI